jgi:hypothetical protein
MAYWLDVWRSLVKNMKAHLYEIWGIIGGKYEGSLVGCMMSYCWEIWLLIGWMYDSSLVKNIWRLIYVRYYGSLVGSMMVHWWEILFEVSLVGCMTAPWWKKKRLIYLRYDGSLVGNMMPHGRVLKQFFWPVPVLDILPKGHDLTSSQSWSQHFFIYFGIFFYQTEYCLRDRYYHLKYSFPSKIDPPHTFHLWIIRVHDCYDTR